MLTRAVLIFVGGALFLLGIYFAFKGLDRLGEPDKRPVVYLYGGYAIGVLGPFICFVLWQVLVCHVPLPRFF